MPQIADANALLDQVRDEDYRRSWARPPGWEDPASPSDAPHGGFVDIYVNDVIVEALAADEPLSRWPEGSIIAKDGWNDAGATDLRYLALMERRGEGWFFAEFSASDRIVIANEDARKCTSCHHGAGDGVLAFGFPE